MACKERKEMTTPSSVNLVRTEKKKKFKLFSDHNGSLLRQQPGADFMGSQVLSCPGFGLQTAITNFETGDWDGLACMVQDEQVLSCHECLAYQKVMGTTWSRS